MISSLKRKLDSKFNPEKAGDVAINNLQALTELLNTGADPIKNTAIQDASAASFADWNATSTEGAGNGTNGAGIKEILGSLERLFPLLEDDQVMQGQVHDILKAFSHMGFTAGG